MNFNFLKILNITVVIFGTSLVAACGNQTTDMESRLALVKQSVTYDMKDPSSADYRNIKVFNNTEVRKALVCGEVNSKNSFGAYVGFKRFIADYDANYIVEGDLLKSPPESIQPKVLLDTTPLSKSSFESAQSTAASRISTEIIKAQTEELRGALSRGEIYSNASDALAPMKQKLAEVDSAANLVVFDEYWSKLCKG